MSFDYVALWTDTESVFLALVIFLATMKFLRILKFNKHISIVTKSLAISKGPLLSYSVCFVVALLGFATFGNITFGSSAYMFSTFPRSIVNSFEMILGKGEKNLRFNTGRKNRFTSNLLLILTSDSTTYAYMTSGTLKIDFHWHVFGYAHERT